MSSDNHYPVASNEAERLQQLLDLHILDTGEDPHLDHITQMVAGLFEAPIVLISLVDTERQWFKSCVGLDSKQTPREDAFCNYAIIDDGGFEVASALDDPRFAENRLVTGDPHIRYYLGMPLSVRGQRIGTLCVIDTKPRSPADHATRKRLADFAQLASREIEVRETLRETLQLVRGSLQVG